MRELGVSKKWDKLKNPLWTTFRFPRKDKDWQIEEVVKVVFKPRSKLREVLGIARIIRKQPKDLSKDYHYSFGGGCYQPNGPDVITPEEAKEDGFTYMGHGDTTAMKSWFYAMYGYQRCCHEPINKLTLYWIEQIGGIE